MADAGRLEINILYKMFAKSSATFEKIKQFWIENHICHFLV